MGILNSQNTILQAVLTQKGREMLLSNNKKFQITKFAFRDEGVNYNTITETLSGDVSFTGPVIEASINENNVMKNFLLRTVTNYSDYISQNVSTTVIPSNEYQISYTKKGSAQFSLSDYNNESMQISFALELNSGFSLSNSFVIDMSNFWKFNNCYFDFKGLSPVGFISSESITSNYWYVFDTSYTINDIIKPVIIGISSQHKAPGSVDLVSFTNDFNSQSIQFMLELPKESALNLYQYFFKNFVSSVTESIRIYNYDTVITPLTQFYGINTSYTSIGTNIPITITI